MTIDKELYEHAAKMAAEMKKKRLRLEALSESWEREDAASEPSPSQWEQLENQYHQAQGREV